MKKGEGRKTHKSKGEKKNHQKVKKKNCIQLRVITANDQCQTKPKTTKKKANKTNKIKGESAKNVVKIRMKLK